MAHNYYNFKYSNENYLILRTIETYSRTASGKSWKSKPDTVEKEVIPPKYYENYITSIPFFNNFGKGASCRAAFTYNAPGYLPTTVTTISPNREVKKIAVFRFISKDRLLVNAGWREKEIVENAKSFETHFIDGVEMLTLFTEDTGVCASGTFDRSHNTWRA